MARSVALIKTFEDLDMARALELVTSAADIGARHVQMTTMDDEQNENGAYYRWKVVAILSQTEEVEREQQVMENLREDLERRTKEPEEEKEKYAPEPDYLDYLSRETTEDHARPAGYEGIALEPEDLPYAHGKTRDEDADAEDMPRRGIFPRMPYE